jgi:pre-rRNA-processing protein TSR2
MASSSAQPQPQSSQPQPQPPDPTLVLFARGVIARLEVWPALRVAVEQNWGGPSSREKRLWLASEIVDAFDTGINNPSTSASTSSSSSADAHAKKKKNSNKATLLPDAEYVAMMLAQVLEDEFDAEFEDGSLEVVAADVVALWGAGEDVVREWERRAEGVRGKKVDVHMQEEQEEDEGDEDEWEDEESGEEDEEMDVDADAAPQLMPATATTSAEVQRPAKPKPTIDEDGFTLVQKGRR